jgi:hypothetical protein
MHVVTMGHRRHRRSRLHAFRDDPHLLCRRPSPTPFGTRQHRDCRHYGPLTRQLTGSLPMPSISRQGGRHRMRTLWPLAVGKKIQARYDGRGSNGSYSGSWITTLTVEKAEKITTKARTFDTFVVVYEVEGLLPNHFKSTLRQWYAPEPGVTVKWDYSDNRAQERSLEATVIRR